jgi:ribosomal protein S27AE
MANENKPSSKKCFKCGVDKALSEFYRHPMMADGHLNKCKECNKADTRRNRAKRVDYYREYDRARGNRQSKEYKDGYYLAFPKKTKARTAVGNAIRDGKLVKPKTCENCGSGGTIHGHHDDYDLPLDVRWLCAPCHRRWHLENGPGANGE